MVTGIVPTFSKDSIHNFSVIELTHQESKYGLQLHVKYNTPYFKEGFALPSGKYSISGQISLYCKSKGIHQTDVYSFNKEIGISKELEVHKIDSFWQEVFNSLPLIDQKSEAMKQKDSNGKITVHVDFELFNENDMYLSYPILRLQTTAK